MTCDITMAAFLHSFASKQRRMLGSMDFVQIKYMRLGGIPASRLAKMYQCSTQRIYQIASRNLSELFPSMEARMWFHAGVDAAKECVEESDRGTMSPISRGRQRWLQHRREVREQWMKNLNRTKECARNKDTEEEYISEVDDDCRCEEDEKLSSVILNNLAENSQQKHKNRWRYHPIVLKFAYILRSYSAVCYEYLRQVLPFPSRQVLATRYKSVERRLEDSHQSFNGLDYIITSYFDRHPLPVMNEPLTCTISIDAFSISVFERKAVQLSCIGMASPELPAFIPDQLMSEKLEIGIDLAEGDDGSGPHSLQEKCDSIFLVVLNPLNWNQPSAILSAFSWKNGHADRDIVRLLLECITRLKDYNIEVCALASDGDTGYSILHNAFAELWRDKRDKDFFDIFNCICLQGHYKVPIDKTMFTVRAFPIADPLHALKIARSRVLEHTIYLAQGIAVSSADFHIFEDKGWYRERTQLAKLSDFNAIMMFSPETILECLEHDEYGAASYLWPWVALMMVIRVPFLSLSCRCSLLNAAFNMFQFFYNQNLKKDFGPHKVAVRGKDNDGVCFFEPSYLLRVLHLILCIYNILVNHPHQLRLSAMGSHINENIIGRIRVGCHGDPRFETVMRVIAKAEVRRLLQGELGVDYTVRGRDNVGGTKLDTGVTCDLEGINFVNPTNTLIDALRSNCQEGAKHAFQELCEFLQIVKTRGSEVPKLYKPNLSANSGIMARLLQFK